MRKLKVRFRQSFLAFVVAGVCALVAGFLLYDSDWLQASVLSIRDQEIIEDKKRDIAYKKQEQMLDVFLGQEQDFDAIFLTVNFDPELIVFSTGDMIQQLDFTLIQQQGGLWKWKANNSGNLDLEQSLFILPFEGPQRDVLLSEAELLLSDGSTKSLAVGYLDTPLYHHK